MPVSFPQVRVGEPIRHEALSVFPLFTETESPIEYHLSDEAIAAEALLVEEVSEGGSVPELLVENKGDLRVLFIEGEELVGAKQNRVLNTSVLVPAKTRLKIPVSCVEQGRWGYRSRHFGSSGRHSPSSLRHALKRSVTKSLRAKMGHRSDQGEVWEEVSRQQTKMAAPSSTMAMSDTFLAYEKPVEEFRNKLGYVEGCSGMAAAIGEKVVVVDLFDKRSTCKQVWKRLISGLILDAIESGKQGKQATTADVETFLGQLDGAEWEQVKPVGEGEEYRAEIATTHGSALLCEASPVHLSEVADR